MKKFRLVVLLSIVLVILLAFNAAAQSVNLNQAMKPFWDLIKYLFITLPSNSFKLAYFKFILFLICGTAYLIIVRKLPFMHDADESAKKRGDILAWLLALASVVFIPDKAVQFMLKEWGMFATIFLGVALPVLIFLAFANKDTKARGIAMIVGGALLLIFGGLLTGVPGAGWMVVAAFISMIIGGILLLGANNGWFPTAGAGGDPHAPHGPAAPADPHAPAAPAGAPGGGQNRVENILREMSGLTPEEFVELNQQLQQRAQQRGS